MVLIQWVRGVQKLHMTEGGEPCSAFLHYDELCTDVIPTMM